jgi:hypothetical protein
MQNKSKLNLYNIEVVKPANHLAAPQKTMANLKVALLAILAVTTLASIGQSLGSFESKVSFADKTFQTSSISSSLSSKSVR